MSIVKLATSTNPKWIQGMHLRRGAFTNYCQNKGYNGVTAECIAEGKKSADELTRKRANLAQRFHNMNKKKGLRHANSPIRAGFAGQ
jgi:hypothetical protein